MTTDQSPTRTVRAIALDILNTWGHGKVNYAAKPYLAALGTMNTRDPAVCYGAEDGKSIALYFLSNASSFRGARAKELKAELKALFGIK
jgi:hypothetical protein